MTTDPPEIGESADQTQAVGSAFLSQALERLNGQSEVRVIGFQAIEKIGLPAGIVPIDVFGQGEENR